MKLIKASDDIIEFIDKILESTGLKGYIEFRMLNNESQKALVTVSKGNNTVEYFAGVSPIVVIYINENVWYRIDDDRMREILVRDALTGISYDTEKDKLNINKPDINIYAGSYMKYGESLIQAAETVTLALRQIDDEKKEARAAKKGNE